MKNFEDLCRQKAICESNITHYDNLLKELTKEYYGVIKDLQEICPHNKLKTDHSYVSGSYYDRAEYTTQHTCEICNKLIEKKTVKGYFG